MSLDTKVRVKWHLQLIYYTQKAFGLLWGKNSLCNQATQGDRCDKDVDYNRDETGEDTDDGGPKMSKKKKSFMCAVWFWRKISV